jgi:hypothetical protein
MGAMDLPYLRRVGAWHAHMRIVHAPTQPALQPSLVVAVERLDFQCEIAGGHASHWHILFTENRPFGASLARLLKKAQQDAARRRVVLRPENSRALIACRG